MCTGAGGEDKETQTFSHKKMRWYYKHNCKCTIYSTQIQCENLLTWFKVYVKVSLVVHWVTFSAIFIRINVPPPPPPTPPHRCGGGGGGGTSWLSLMQYAIAWRWRYDETIDSRYRIPCSPTRTMYPELHYILHSMYCKYVHASLYIAIKLYKVHKYHAIEIDIFHTTTRYVYFLHLISSHPPTLLLIQERLYLPHREKKD